MGNDMTTTPSATRFGDLLQQYRKRSRFTQSELSGFSTVSVRAIRNLELGQAKNPRRETVRLLADALRLGGEQRAALQLAAGHGADDAAFDDLPTLSPAETRPLRGRAVELERLLHFFRTGQQRLAAVTGLGGVGKSRLALAVAHALQAEDGMTTLWWRLPGSVARDRTDHRFLPPLAGMDGLLAARGGLADDTIRLIGERPVLLVLDGNDAEQVGQETVDTLLDTCRNLMVLETSRTTRGHLWRGFRLALRPLPVPALNAIDNLRRVEAAPAMAVLLDRLADAQAGVRVDQSNVAEILEICAQLDGLPRALESAASWLMVSSPTELVKLARTEPHVVAESIDGDREVGWVGEALTHALSVLTPAQIALLVGLSCWETPWAMEQLVARLDIDRVQAAAAVHAYLQCGLIRQMPSANHVVFGIVHVMRAHLQARSDQPGDPIYGTSDRNEGEKHDDEDSDWSPRGFRPTAGLLRGRPGRDDAA
ncbi:helix-turn-helix domain-containing protein [Streptomyces sioyaensis]|uniref:helix-turn-helix domain-containing protein n=1 Tax=Streptomyces sioyaensis TaxID=67364 RepID=UPI0036F11AC7